MDLLQRSRSGEAAEGRFRPSSPGHNEPGFNEAAAVKLRKDDQRMQAA